MNRKFKKDCMLMLAMLLAIMSAGVWSPDKARASDEYDAMREAWKEMLTGGSGLDPLDADIAAGLDEIEEEANQFWSAMVKTSGRSYLWSDIPGLGNSVHIRTVYERIKVMALAYSMQDSSLYLDAGLETDIVSALDYMYATRYNENTTTTPSGTSNWWDWQIGIPMALNDAVVLMYDALSSSQVANFAAAVERFTPSVNLTGANRSWKAIVVGVRGILVKDSTKLLSVRDGLSQIFDYVTSGDGFYRDGSFIQHSRFPYTGGYGLSLLKAMGDLLYMLHGTSWDVIDPDVENVWSWVYDAYQPVIYKGAIMDNVRGREISRNYSQDRAAGHEAIQGIMKLALVAPASQEIDFKRMVKAWIEQDTFLSFYQTASVPLVQLAKDIAADSSIALADELVLYKQYAGMDRAVQLRPGYGFGLAMYSSRIGSFEAINSENGKAWYTSAGMTSLYNGDLGQFSDDYWPTVDSYRLPGTSVLSGTPTSSHTSVNQWTGGTAMDGLYGVSGMDLSYSGNSLSARKSWFMLDDEIVALGAGITSTDGIAAETVIENRKLGAAGNEALTVNGTVVSDSLGWSDTIDDVSWAHLQGNAASSDIGYYFPETPDIDMKREARTGNWKQLNTRPVSPSTPITRNYMTMWVDHGVNPTGAEYAYALLPGKTSSQVASYSSNPDFVVLENSSAVQAVKESSLGIVGANFWTDTTQTVDLITSSAKASVKTKESLDGEQLSVSISDPTQLNAGAIQLELDRSAVSYTADTGVTVTQLSPTIKLSVNVAGAKGKSFHTSFELGEPEPAMEVIVDNADTSGAVTKSGGWKTGTVGNDKYGANYFHDDNAGKGEKWLTFAPNLPEAGTYELFLSWTAHFNRSTAVPIDIVFDGGTAATTVDQTTGGGVWQSLGTYAFEAGQGGNGLTIRNDGTVGYVAADAVRFVRVPDPDPVPEVEPVIIDNTDAGAAKTGVWKAEATQTDRYGINY
ncbi:polysaccharide lyase family 8 super-sandwich domain-containing protein [Paenibacillus sp. strain BS8-2]